MPQTLVSTVPSLNLRNTANDALKPFFSIFPLPTGPDNSNGTTAAFVTNYSNPQSQDSYALRIDHNLTDKLTIFGRLSYSPQESLTLFPQRSQAAKLEGDTRTLTIGANYAIKANLTNEFRFNWSRNFALNGSQFYSFNGTTEPPRSLWAPDPFTEESVISYLFAGSVFSTNPGNTGLRKQLNITDTLTWVKGNHLLKFGMDYRRSPSRQESADYQFTVNFSSLTAVRNAVATTVSFTANDPLFTYYEWQNFGAFAQDTWRVSNRLTLDYGIRWDVNPPPNISPERRLAVLDFVNPIRLAEPGAQLYPTVWGGIAPRIGASYQLFTKDGRQTVIRGGYGLFYDVGSGSTGSVSGAFFPFTVSRSSISVPFPFSAAVLTPPVISTTTPYSQGSFLAQYDEGYVLPRVHQWNVAIEQGLGKDQTLSVTYVGNAGRRLLRQALISPISRSYPIASPDFASSTGFNLVSNAEGRSDSSDYNAMQVQFNRRSKNISTIVNYTWSHSIDTSSSSANVLSTNYFKVDPNVDRADSAFDRRHSFSTAVTWSLPGVSRNLSPFLHALTKEWSLDTIFQYQTSYPIEIQYQDISANNNLSSLLLRPDLVEGQPIWIDSNGPLGRVLNPAAFSVPTTTRQGNLPRNLIRVASLWQPDIALSRTILFGERIKLRLKGEVFNFINHPMFASPSYILGTKSTNGTFITSGTFGQFTNMLNRTTASEGIALSSIYAPGGPRSVQLSFKLSF